MRRPFVVGLLAVVCGVALALALNAWVFTLASISSDSMAPTLVTGETVLVNKVGGISRGDVVGFDGRGVFVPLDHEPVVFAKRVIGVGGDRVTCCQADKVLVNGEPIDEPYVPSAAQDTLPFDVVVPQGSLWVEGDNRIASADSRAHLGEPGGGFVPEDKVVGKAVAIVWPFSQARTVAGS